MTETPPLESPITTHNRALAFQVLKQTSTFSRYPAVSEQVQCLPLETHKLHKHGYNPALNASGLMAYRYHVSKLGTRLAVAQLGDNGSVISDREIAISGKSVDDPKLFTHAGSEYISWVEATWDDADYQRTIRCVVKFAKFNGAQISTIEQHTIGKNNGTALEKNWVYWSHAGQLYVIYEASPTQRIFRVSDNGQWVEMASDGIVWPYGTARGDTAPLPYEGKLLRFFHSRLDNEFLGTRHRYFIGAVLMNAEPPFKVERVSKRPVIFGSEISTVKKKDCDHFKPNVVFGGGAVETKGGFLLSLGVNDSESVLARILPEQLNF